MVFLQENTNIHGNFLVSVGLWQKLTVSVTVSDPECTVVWIATDEKEDDKNNSTRRKRTRR